MTDSARKQAIPNERPSCANVKIRVAINDVIGYKVDFDTDEEGRKELTYRFKIIDLTPLELFEQVIQGHNVTSVCIDAFGQFHRGKDYFKESQVICVDLDNDQDILLFDENGQPIKDENGKQKRARIRCDDEDYITFDDLLADPFVQRFALFIYTTPSHHPDHHKLRVVFLLPEKVTDKEEFERLLRLFIWKFKSDPSCKDAGRFFYGMGRGGQSHFLGNWLTDEAIKGLSEEFEKAHPKIDRAESIKKIVAYANPKKGADLKRFYVECARRRGDEIISQSVGPSIGSDGKKISGNRHNARARVAYWFGGLVAGGVMEEFEALGFLEQSISGNNDNFSKAMKNAKECFYAGMSKPITLDDLERERRARKVDSCTYYDYVDESGKLLYQTFKNKKGVWRNRRFDAQGREARTLYGGWFDDDNGFLKKIKGANDETRAPHSNAVWLDACPNALYRADKLAALRAGDLVVIATNEIQAHKFEGFGLVATTAGNVEGDGWIDEFGPLFRGLNVVVCAGKQNITIASSCRKGSAKRVRIFRPEDGYKPTRQELLKVIDELPDYGEIRLNSRITIIPTDKDDTSDPPITDDPISDKELRQVIATTGSYKEATSELLKALGVRGRHTRIIDALAILATDSKIVESKLTEGVNLGLIRAYASQFRGEYDSDQPTRAEIEESLKSEKDMDRLKELKEKLDKLKRKRSNRVSRDLCALRNACIKAGAVYRIKDVGFFGFLDYWQGAPEFKDKDAIPGRYRLHFLRFVALVLQRQKEITAKTGRDGLTQAANEIAAEILAWVAIRKTALGDQPQTETESTPPAKDPLKVAEQKRQVLIRAYNNYLPYVGKENAEQVFEMLKSEALLVTDNKEMSPQNERLHLGDIEAERAFLRIAEHFRHSWQAQGCTRVGQIKLRLWPLLLTFLNTLLTGSSNSSVKREKIKDFALKMAKSVLDTAGSLMSNINVGHGEPETGADSDQIFGSEPDGDGMNIVVEIGPEPFDTDPVVIDDDSPDETISAENSQPEPVDVDPSPPRVIEFPPEAKGPERERVNDRGYRGPCIYAAPDGDFSGHTVSSAGEAGGMHYLNFVSLDGSGCDGGVPLESLWYPDEHFKPDADLCDLWRKLRLGGAA